MLAGTAGEALAETSEIGPNTSAAAGVGEVMSATAMTASVAARIAYREINTADRRVTMRLIARSPIGVRRRCCRDGRQHGRRPRRSPRASNGGSVAYAP